MAGMADVKKFTFELLPSFSWHKWLDWFDEWGISRGGLVTVMYFGLFGSAMYTVPEFVPLVFGWLLGTMPIWAPIAVLLTFSQVWMWYVRALYIFKKTNPILLEVKMPKDVFKSPRAMEQVFTSLWIRSAETTFIDRAWEGGVRPYFSFELVSFGGEVHFYIWTRKGYRNIIESNMYAQYPEVEIHEVEDYASKFVYDPKKHGCFVTEYRVEPVRGGKEDAYPMRSYVDFELDKDPKEEVMVDPFAQVVEVLSSMKPHEQVWIQIIIRSHVDIKDWRDLVRKEVDRIRFEQGLVTKGTPHHFEEGYEFNEERPPLIGSAEHQKALLTSMERNLGKLPFDFGGRGIYIAPKDKMDSPNFTAMRWIWRPFANPHFGSYWRPRRYQNTLDYPWQDFRGFRNILMTRRGIDAFRRRSWFHSPWTVPHNVQSVELLATLWHPPSRAVKSPGLQRLPSKKGEPPPNLPQ